MPQDFENGTLATLFFQGKTVKKVTFDRYTIAISFTDGTVLSAESEGDANTQLRVEQSFD